MILTIIAFTLSGLEYRHTLFDITFLAAILQPAQ
jgi:hypothetical protein